MATTKKSAKGDTKPAQDFSIIEQAGLKAKNLADQYKTEIGNRLSAVFILAFAADLAGLVVAVPTAITTQQGSVQLTAAQATALGKGYLLAKGFRETVKSQEPGDDVLLAYGVGARTNKKLVKDVTAALQMILDRILAMPAEAAMFEFVTEDTDALKAALTAIKDADKAQEAGRAAAPQTTKDRNATARRILAGIKKIAGAGMRALVDNPTAYANFEALITKKAV